MIEIKSRESAKAGAGRNRPYAFGDGEASLRGPGIVGLAIAALVVYFSQFFKSAEAKAPDGEEASDGQGARSDDVIAREAPRSHAPVRLEEGGEDPALAAAPVTDVVEAEGRTVLNFPRATLGSGWFTPTVTIIEPGPGFSIHAPVASNSDRPPVALPDPTAGADAAGVDAAAGGSATAAQRSRDADTDEEEARNRAPQRRGPVELNEMTVCPAFLITVGMLLEGASDPDGDALSVTDLVASSGTLERTDGGWIYTPDPTVTGPVVLSYQITDGKDSIEQTASFEIVPNVIEGTNDDDLLVGSECIDEIDGLDGDDDIVAHGGNDLIRGGDGDDRIVGGRGDDTIFAGAGDDIVHAGAGDDVVYGGTGNDWLIAGAGDDVVYGEDGDDTIEGDGGSDILFGGAGDDTVSDGTGEDIVDGGDGNDVVMATADQSHDILDGGAGTDTLDVSDADTDATVDLLAGTAQMGSAPADSIAGFEHVVSGDGDDTVTGNDQDTEIETAGGDDTVTDGAGADVVDTGDGDDRVIVFSDTDADMFDGGEGHDTLDLSDETQDLVVDLDEGIVVAVTTEEAAPSGDEDTDATVEEERVGALAADADAEEDEEDDDHADHVENFEAIVTGAGDDTIVAGDEDAEFWGGDGANTFDFREALVPSSDGVRRFDIHDFKAGDHVRTALFDIFADEDEDDGEKLAKILRGEDEDHGKRETLRYHHDHDEDKAVTVISVDEDDDDHFDVDIYLHGEHFLGFVELPWT